MFQLFATPIKGMYWPKDDQDPNSGVPVTIIGMREDEEGRLTAMAIDADSVYDGYYDPARLDWTTATPMHANASELLRQTNLDMV